MKTMYVAILMLIVIHTLDMELTRTFVGDDWRRETFPVMSATIKAIGIYPALWASRLCVYAGILFALERGKDVRVRRLLYVLTAMYWAAMVQWLFTLHLVSFPVN